MYMVSLYHKVQEEFLQPNNPTTIRNTVAPTIQLHREAMEESILFKLNIANYPGSSSYISVYFVKQQLTVQICNRMTHRYA